MSAAHVDVVVAGSGDAAGRAVRAAERAGAHVRRLDGADIVALVRPADAVRGVYHRADGGGEALLEAVAVVFAAAGPTEGQSLANAARAAGAHANANGHLATDATARVLDPSGLSIPGLYAAGLYAASAGGTTAEDAGARAAARAATRAP